LLDVRIRFSSEIYLPENFFIYEYNDTNIRYIYFLIFLQDKSHFNENNKNS